MSIVIPCRNEAGTLGLLIQRLQRAAVGFGKCQILVVDNESKDNSAEIAREAGAEIIRCSELGYGAALRHGIFHARHELIVMLDADLTYSPEELPRLVKSFELLGADLLIGDRLHRVTDKAAMPFMHRYFGTPLLTFLLKRLFSSLDQLRDCNSGYRVFRKADFLIWNPQSLGMELASEMLACAALKKSKVISLPINFSVSPVQRRPHLRPWRDGFRHLFKIFEVRISSWKKRDECTEVLQKNLNSVRSISKTQL